MALRLSGLQNHRAAIGQCRMALTLIRPTKPSWCHRAMPDGADAYPAYKIIVLLSGNAGWR